jgi:hypothetical protein
MVNKAKTWWYAIINSKDNTDTVFPDLTGGAAEYIMGVTGASIKKYDSYDRAWAQVAAHKQLLIRSANKKAQMGPQATLPYQQPGWSKLSETQGRTGGRSAEHKIREPPLKLMGLNPLVKINGEAFGINLGPEMELMDGLSPLGLTEQQKRPLTKGLIHVVALPNWVRWRTRKARRKGYVDDGCGFGRVSTPKESRRWLHYQN